MRSIYLALACLAYTSHARRISESKTHQRQAPNSLEAFLFAVNPTARASSLARRQASRMSFPLGGGLPPRSASSPARNPQARNTQASSPFSKLQSYNQEMLSSIEDLRAKRDDWDRQILAEEEEKNNVNKQLSALRDRLQQLDESLERKALERDEYEKTIQDTEEAYMKIVKDSQDLLQMLKRETVSLSAKKKSSVPEKKPVQKESSRKATPIELEPVVETVAALDSTESQTDEEIELDEAESLEDDDIRKMTLEITGHR